MIGLDSVKSYHLLQKKGSEGLGAEISRLDAKRKLFEDYKKQESAFLNALETLEQIQQQRNEYLSQIRSIAEERISTNPLDLSARYCLYLLNSLTENEEQNESLESRLVESSCGKYMAEPEESDYRLPSDIESVTERFRELERIQSQTNYNRSIAKDTRDTVKVELAHAREKFHKCSHVIPAHERGFHEKMADFEAEIKSVKSSHENLEARKERGDKRCALIRDLCNEIDTAKTNFPMGTTYQMLHSVKAILNSVNQDTDLFMTHAKALVSMAAEKPVSVVKPAASKPVSDIAELSRQIRARINALPTSPRSARKQ